VIQITTAVGVVIPARNQADTIAQCIHSIFAANSYVGWRNSLWIVVVADACRDKTAKIARDVVGAFGEVLEVAVQSSGTARGIGANTVLEHFHPRPQHAILLANADADTCVRRDWIDIQLKRQEAGVGSIAHPANIAAESVAFPRRFALNRQYSYAARRQAPG
jgi:cellulose synthase/poly-beta-1,6-N-acetylglucosamine synthase-like glycosyltransferase